MPKVRMQDGSVIDIDPSNLLADDGQTVLNIPTGPVFTTDDLERVRAEEKNKLYGRLDAVQQELTSFKEQVGSLTAAEQRRQAQLKEEEARLEAEARAKENEELDAKTLLQRREQEWREEQARLQSEWDKRFETLEQQRQQEAALREKEREFNDLKDYTLAQVQDNSDKIAPQLRRFIGGNTREEIDASIQRAIESTNEIAAEMAELTGGGVLQQQVPVGQAAPPAPPSIPGTRVTAAPGADPATQFQTLTQEQIAAMPMDEYAKLRGTLGIGGQSSNRGLYG